MADTRYIVLRFERVSDYGIGGVAAHGRREGELPHVDHERTKDNRFLIGHADLRQLCDERIVELQRKTAESRIESFRRSRHTGRRKALEDALAEAGDDKHALAELVGWPWDPKNTKPWTQGVLSASREFFLDENGAIDPAKTKDFLNFAEAYLLAEFGREVIYARSDGDEETPHVHFVVAPEHEERRTGNPMLSHAQHRLFGMVEIVEDHEGEDDEKLWERRSYELFQDRVAQFAEVYDIDLERGIRRAEDEREKIARGEEVCKRRNVRPSRGRKVAAMLAAEASDDRTESADLLASAKQLKSDAGRKDEEAGAALGAARRKEREAEALMAGISRGMQALENDELAYRPATEKKKEGLKFGPNAPEKEPERRKLREVIRPAYEWLVGFARSLFMRENAVAKREAENRRAASALAAEERRISGRHSEVLGDILNGRGPENYASQDFPDGFRVPHDIDGEELNRLLAEMTNRDLREKHGASRDAAMLIEDDPALALEFQRGAEAIEIIAKKRGYDLETGRHDPKKATDPELAHQHTDSDPEPIRVVVKQKILSR
ncbi:MAG: plasmid recombination protein [Maritimibacter sp.]|nr:plasmid recombination protein [Maritimibacter sp.]